MAEEKRQGFIKGTAILSMSTIIVKAVGLLFSMPLANIVDADAMGYFNAAYEIFAVFNAAATAGLPVAVSRMVSSAYAQGKKKQADRIFSVALLAFFVLGLTFSLMMFIFSQQFADFLKLPGANYSIKTLAPTIFFCAIMSAIRGYFQGRSHMVPTAVSQVIEALTKVLIGISLAVYVNGAFQDSSLSAAAAIVGVSSSAALGMVYLWFYKAWDKRKNLGGPGTDRSVTGRRDILWSLAKLAVPIAIGSCFLQILNLVDASIINGRLQTALGMKEAESAALYGIWGNTIKIYDLPGAIVIALATSLLPVLTAAFTRKDERAVARMTTTSIRISFLVTVPCAVGFILFSRPLGQLFYFNKPATAAGVGELLRVVAVSVIFNGMLYVTNSIMQSMGHVMIPVVNMAIGGVIKIVLNYFLVAIPEINIAGAAISTVANYFIVMILNFIAVYRFIPKAENPFRIFIPTALAAGVMGFVSYFAYIGFAMLFIDKVAVLLAIAVAVAVYGVSVILFRAVKPSDLKMLPKGEKIVKKLHLYEGAHFE